MPNLTKEQISHLLETIKTVVPITLNVSSETKAKVKTQSNDYLQNKNSNINDMLPLSVYYIISKLDSEKQIEFIKNNIEYIKEHDEEVFLYDMLAPEALSHFLSFKVLKEIYKIDKEIFRKLLNRSFDYFFNNFSADDYKELYTDYYDEISKISNANFIDIIDCYDRVDWNKYNVKDIIKDLLEIKNEKIQCKNEFIELILKNYKNKIESFTPYELFRFINHFVDTEMYKRFIIENRKKLSTVFENIFKYDLDEYMSKVNPDREIILVSNFFESMIKKNDIKRLMNYLRPNTLIYLYNKNKEVFSTVTLKEWLEFCLKSGTFNVDFKKIFDTFEIENIEDLFNTKIYSIFNSLESLRYLENKYREGIIIDGQIEKIDESTSIFSKDYFKNLKELKNLLTNKKITKNNYHYKKHFTNLVLYLKNKNIVFNFDDNNLKEIEKLFYKIVMGHSITILFKLKNIESITLFNRLGSIDFDASNFTVDQLKKYNVKDHKKLYNNIEDKYSLYNYKMLVLKLYFMLGYNCTQKILDIDNEISTLEHLIGNVDVKNIVIDKNRNPVLNKKMINILFNDKECSRMKEALTNKNNDLYKYFPRILNEWEMIKINEKDKNLNTILEFLKSDEIALPQKYYRLEGKFKFIGCGNNIVNETLYLHDEMLKRFESTIPKIIGVHNNYTYELLDLKDMNSLVVGNKTDCCFTVLGNGYSCLKHATTSKNGRVLVIKKDDILLAHSWVWRNGNLLCLDNIETSKAIDEVDFLDVYLKFSEEIIKKSFEYEGIYKCIKNVTIGYTDFDKNIIGIKDFPCFVSKSCNIDKKEFVKRIGNNRKVLEVLPQPIEVTYSDSKNVQYLIKGNGDFNLYQSNYLYKDERPRVYYFNCCDTYDEKYLDEINKRINSLRYIKFEQENNLDLFKNIEIKTLKEVYCNDDWYFIVYDDGTQEKYINSSDNRAYTEMNKLIKEKEYVKVLK